MTEQAKDKNPAKEETTELPPAVAPNRLHSGTQPPCVHRAPSDAGPEGAEAPEAPERGPPGRRAHTPAPDGTGSAPAKAREPQLLRLCGEASYFKSEVFINSVIESLSHV